MTEDSKRPLITLAIFGLLFGAGILVLRYVSPPKESAPAAAEQAPSQSSDEAPAAQLDDPSEAESLVLETPDFRAEWTSVGGGLRSLQLSKDRFSVDGEKAELVTTSMPAYLPFRQTVRGAKAGPLPRFSVESRGPDQGVLRVRDDGLVISRKLEAKEGYRIVSTTRIENDGAEPRTVTVVDESHHY